MRRAPLRAEASGLIAFMIAIASVFLYFKTGEGPFAGAAFVSGIAAVLLARPIRD